MPLVLDGSGGISGVDGTASNPAIEGTDSNTGIFYPAADTVAIGTNGTEALRVNSSQNVGIGTTSPTDALTVGTSSVGKNIRINSSSNGNNGLLRMYDLGGTERLQLGVNSTGEAVYYAPTGSVHAWYVNTERMRLDASGKLNLGVTSGNASFNIGGSGTVGIDFTNTGASATNAILGYYNNTYGALAVGDICVYAVGGRNVVLMADNASGIIKFSTGGNTERARITSGGQLLVGTTTGQQNTEIAAFTNAGSGSVVLRIQRSGENNAYIGSSTAQPFQVYDSGIVQRFVVTSAGTCLNTTGTYGTLSDAKLKENIVDATPKLDDLMKVKVRNYELKSEPNSKYLGFVAQELREIFPAMIDETEDEDDNGEKTGEVTLSVKTTVFIPMLVKAIQELNAKVETQAAEIALLKGAA